MSLMSLASRPEGNAWSLCLPIRSRHATALVWWGARQKCRPPPPWGANEMLARLCQPSRTRRGKGRARELMRDNAVPDWRIPPCVRPNQVPSPNSKRDCPTHGCSAFRLQSFFFFFFSLMLFSAGDRVCWSALTRPLWGGRVGGGIQQTRQQVESSGLIAWE